jgi:hypothetical protein
MSDKPHSSHVRYLLLLQLTVLFGVFVSWLLGQLPIGTNNPVYWIWWLALALVVWMSAAWYRATSLDEMYTPADREAIVIPKATALSGLTTTLSLICFVVMLIASGLGQKPAAKPSEYVLVVPPILLFTTCAFHFLRLFFHAQRFGVLFMRGGKTFCNQSPRAFAFGKWGAFIVGLLFLVMAAVLFFLLRSLIASTI